MIVESGRKDVGAVQQLGERGVGGRSSRLSRVELSVELWVHRSEFCSRGIAEEGNLR